jgi:hypothetical protein
MNIDASPTDSTKHNNSKNKNLGTFHERLFAMELIIIIIIIIII